MKKNKKKNFRGNNGFKVSAVNMASIEIEVDFDKIKKSYDISLPIVLADRNKPSFANSVQTGMILIVANAEVALGFQAHTGIMLDNDVAVATFGLAMIGHCLLCEAGVDINDLK